MTRVRSAPLQQGRSTCATARLSNVWAHITPFHVLHAFAGGQSSIAKASWALARLNLQRCRCWPAVCALAAQHAPRLNGREVSNVLWALATAGVEDSAACGALAAQARALAPQFNMQDVANTAWACAKVRGALRASASAQRALHSWAWRLAQCSTCRIVLKVEKAALQHVSRRPACPDPRMYCIAAVHCCLRMLEHRRPCS